LAHLHREGIGNELVENIKAAENQKLQSRESVRKRLNDGKSGNPFLGYSECRFCINFPSLRLSSVTTFTLLDYFPSNCDFIPMEVAGLALAIYPATVLAFEQYKKGARYISDWARYRRKYEAFIRDMEGQQLFFEGILQDLLCGGSDPFLTGSSSQSKDSFLRIATDASFTGWKSPVLKQRLKARLDSRYDWCVYTIKRIYDIMIELGELLDIQAVRFSFSGR